jgi:hypothetical protein
MRRYEHLEHPIAIGRFGAPTGHLHSRTTRCDRPPGDLSPPSADRLIQTDPHHQVAAQAVTQLSERGAAVAAAPRAKPPRPAQPHPLHQHAVDRIPSAIATTIRLECSQRSWGTLGWPGFVTIQRRSTMVEVGDRVLVESEKVGSVTRSGMVTAVEDRLITVRWDSGSESVFVPSAGSLQVTGHQPPPGEGDSS